MCGESTSNVVAYTNFLRGEARSRGGSGINIRREERVLKLVVECHDLLKCSIINRLSKEVHGQSCIILHWVFVAQGLVSKGQKVPIALGKGHGKHHAVGWMCVDGVDVLFGEGREVDASGEVVIEG